MYRFVRQLSCELISRRFVDVHYLKQVQIYWDSFSFKKLEIITNGTGILQMPTMAQKIMNNDPQIALKPFKCWTVVQIMNYNGARILEKQPMAEVWKWKSMMVVKCQPWRIWSEFSCWPQDLWNIRRASWFSCNPSCSTSPYKSYLLQGAFLTVPTNFQYQNEKWWAANQRFCSMNFSKYKRSSLVEQRFSF